MEPSVTIKGTVAQFRGCLVPRPTPARLAMLHNVNQDCSLFLQAAGIKKESEKHKALKKTIQTLHRLYMHQFKYVEEQEKEANRLIAQARICLPWLAKYEDSWPARIYLKRYVDGRRPHRILRREKLRSHKRSTKCLKVPDPPLNDHDPFLQDFLRSLTPNLEHHCDAFVKLGIRDQKTLQAFLSWSQGTQFQFLDENHELLQLTTLEKKGLLVGCGSLAQRALERSFDHMVKSDTCSLK